MASKGTLELRLDDHPERSETGFRNWLDLIKDEADEEDWGWLLPDRRLSFRHLDASPPRLRTEFSAGAEASSAIVQINEPTTAGSENPLSGIAVDHQGIRYVVRQGTLHKNRVSPRIDVDEFQRLTRLRPLVMMVGDAPAKRRWFVVAQVDRVDAATVVAQTADFVNRCWTARLSHVEDEGDEEGIDDIFGSEERGGTSTVVPTPDPREVRRIQGYVWEQLHARLKAAGIVMRKPRHAEGYEVDAEILAPGGPILLEIKTSTSPADVYTGIGQLEIYPKLIARLQGHRRVLLMPGDLRPSFARAVEGLNVELHAYRLTDMNAKPIATFSEQFLFLCGVALAGVG